MNPPSAPVPLPPVPIPNSYWVRPGRLLAGEYPGAPAQTTTRDRIQRLLRAGVTAFIDLTVEGELEPYVSMLPRDGSVTHQRWPIPDHDLPASALYMQRILDAIDASIDAGRCVYVHCRAGIGRTGTTIGCHLVRSGLDPHVALDHLNQLWRQTARSQNWSSVPETDEQYRYVEQWIEPVTAGASVNVDLPQRCEGALIGLISGEAVSSLAAAGHFDTEQILHGITPPIRTFELGPDAAMTVSVLNSLRERGGHDAQDQMQRYFEWSRSAPAGSVDAELRRALATWQWSRKPNAGSHDPRNLNPHSLARTLAAALFSPADPAVAMDVAADVSRTTQQSPVVLDVCRLWSAILVDALAGASGKDLLSLHATRAVGLLRKRRLRSEVSALFDDGWRSAPATGDDVISVCVRALGASAKAGGFTEGLTLLGARGPGAVIAGSLYGALAGARFGIAAIPSRWQQAVPQLRALQALARPAG